MVGTGRRAVRQLSHALAKLLAARSANTPYQKNMNPDRLLQHFDQISETPDAVPRLRRFILDLGVRGKLVEQDPEDEPAGKLLRRIEGEKAKFIKANGIKKQLSSPTVIDVESLFEIPNSWNWVQIENVAYSR
jgi:type I restriction enzyme S subunit